MKSRFTAADLRFIGFCAILLAGSTWFSVRYFYTAFPEASIDFRVNREEAGAIAEAKLEAQGNRLAGFRSASNFGYDDEAKTFLEREVGLTEANRLMGGEIRLWRWSYRWFRPKQKEEFDAEVTPRGDWVGFEHAVPEDAPRPSVTDPEARTLAEAFLKLRFGRDPEKLDFVEMSSVKRPSRVDRAFTWKSRDFDVQGASYRFEVDLLGNEPGAYREYLKVPEQWSRDYERLRSKNEVTSILDGALMVLLVAGLVVVLVQRARRHDVRWKLALGIGGFVAVLTLFARLNEFPVREFEYPTTDGYPSFIIRQLLQALLAAVGSGAGIFLLTAGAEPVYREGFGWQLSLGSLCRLRGLRTRTFFLGSCLGLALAGAFLAYQIIFYRVANHFGAWAPADVPYDDLLNTRFPWLFVLLGGLFPAVSEEFLFRMFAVPFLRKLVRSAAVSVVLAGFIWGFGHAGYPNQPFYIRGVEVGLVGIVLGCIMLRWGVLVGLVWHYSIDAVYSALLLLRSPSWYFRLSGAACAGIMLLPVLIALAAYWRRGGFEPEVGARNQDESGNSTAAPAETPTEAAQSLLINYTPLATKLRWAAVVILGVGLLLSLLPIGQLAASPRYALGAEAALAAADAFVRTQQVDPGAYSHFVFPTADTEPLAGKYFLDHGSVGLAAGLFQRNRPMQQWTIRYYRPLDREELTVVVHPESGAILAYAHTVPEEQAGADLPEAEARQRAESLARGLGWDVSGMELKVHTSEKKPHRRDYEVTWEAKPGDPRNLAESRFRVSADVRGAIPAGLRTYWKIPEDYARKRETQTVFSILVLVVRIVVVLGVIVGIVWFLIHRTRQHGNFWPSALKFAIPAALLAAAAPLLSPDELLRPYPTSIPFISYEVTLIAVGLIALVGRAIALTGIAGLIFALFPNALSSLGAANRRRLGFDATVALLAAFGFQLVRRWLVGAYADRFPASTLFQISGHDLVASSVPALSILLGSASAVLTWLASVAAVVLAFRWIRPKWALALVAVLVAVAAIPGGVRTAGEFASAFGFGLLGIAWIAVFCRWFARDNCLAYLVTAWALALAPSVHELMDTSAVFWHMQGWIVVATFAAVFFWLVRPKLAGR